MDHTLSKYVKEKMEMTNEQIWDLLEAYALLQSADRAKNVEGFDLLHEWIQNNCFLALGEK